MKTKGLIGILLLGAAVTAGIYFLFFRSASSVDSGGSSGGSSGTTVIYLDGTDSTSDTSKDKTFGEPATATPADGFVSLVKYPNLQGGSVRSIIATDSGNKGFADIPVSNSKYTALVKEPSTGKIVGAYDVEKNTYASNSNIKNVMNTMSSLKKTTLKSVLDSTSSSGIAKKIGIAN